MRVRKVDDAGDMMFGGDQASIYRDSPETVGQVVESRLNLWRGQWYLDSEEGLPVEQEILGKYTEFFRDPAIQERILDTPGVVEIVAYASQFDRQTRDFQVSTTIETAYSRAARSGQAANQIVITTNVRDAR